MFQHAKKIRAGAFNISFCVMEDLPLMHNILSTMRFVPTHVEAMYVNRELEFIGVSPMFDEINAGSVIPKYDVVVNTTGSGEFAGVDVVRKNE